MVACSICPSRTTIFGLPEMMRRIRRDFSVTHDINASKQTSVRIGRIPSIRGMLVSSSGRVAMLEIRMVMTSSEGCNSPSCRFPIRRTPKITTMYKISERMRTTLTKKRLLSYE